jgi:hypothetical protein
MAVWTNVRDIRPRRTIVKALFEDDGSTVVTGDGVQWDAAIV